MTKTMQKVWAVILAALMFVTVCGAAFSVSMTSNRVTAATTKKSAPIEESLVVKQAKDKKWYAFNKNTNKIQTSYTGIAQNQYGWWRIVKGKVDFNANGLYSNSYGLWMVKNGKVDFDYNGEYTAKDKNTYVVRNGKGVLKSQYKYKTYNCNDLVVRANPNGEYYAFYGNDIAYDYTGIAPNNSGWWRIVWGKVDYNANGVFQNDNGWWYVKNGKVDFSFTGITKYNGVTYAVVGGQAKVKAETETTKTNTKYDSTKLKVKKNNADGQWYAYTEKGKIAYDYTGVAGNDYGWWVIENGRVNFQANGLYANELGTWYVKDGKVDFTFTGTAADVLGVVYNVVNGKVTVSEVK